jgi:hypothetical protein
MIKDAGGGKTCRVTLTSQETIGGYVVEFVPNCVKTFPVMDEVAAWRLDEGAAIVFADATRQTVLRFYTPDATYVAEQERDGIASIEKLGGANTEGLTATNQVGLWNMMREAGEVVCQLELTAKPAGPERFAADLRAGCADKSIAGFAPSVWSVKADQLTLYGGTGYALTFIYDLDGNWRKDPPSGRELVLSKVKE